LGKDLAISRDYDELLRSTPIISYFRELIPRFSRPYNGKDAIFVPTKGEIHQYYIEFDPKIFNFTEKEQNHCMFLDWIKDPEMGEKLPVCLIQDFKPKMCRQYPEKKGWACLNHLDRRYSRSFLAYQRSQIGKAIEVIRTIHEGKISHDCAYDILTLLMDFGEYDLKTLKTFFVTELNISSQDFDNTIEELSSLSLVFLKGDCIEGIPMKDVEKVVDRIMKEMNWHFPK
jgi:Fe-S-cluster containining protein